jgi:hypothetical protein
VVPEIGGCRLRHVLEGHTTGWMRLLWPLLYRPLHNALIDDSLDRAEHALGGRTHQAPRPWSLRVRMLRLYAIHSRRLRRSFRGRR